MSKKSSRGGDANHGNVSPEGMRKAELIGVIWIAFLLLFKFKIKPPEKDE